MCLYREQLLLSVRESYLTMKFVKIFDHAATPCRKLQQRSVI